MWEKVRSVGWFTGSRAEGRDHSQDADVTEVGHPRRTVLRKIRGMKKSLNVAFSSKPTVAPEAGSEQNAYLEVEEYCEQAEEDSHGCETKDQ